VTLAVTRWRGDAAVGLALAGVGVALALLARPIPIGTVGAPGPGLLPTALGLSLIVLGLLAAVRARVERSTEPVPVLEPRAVVTMLALGGAVAAFEPLGFLPTALLFLTVLFRALGAGWRKAVLLGVAIGGGAWLLFERALSVQLPAGIMPL
jgi:putative tricarboxylic transport membrane protein